MPTHRNLKTDLGQVTIPTQDLVIVNDAVLETPIAPEIIERLTGTIEETLAGLLGTVKVYGIEPRGPLTFSWDLPTLVGYRPHPNATRQALYLEGLARMRAWCAARGITPPAVVEEHEYGEAIAHYQHGTIHLDLLRCCEGERGETPCDACRVGGQDDTTPIGAIAHELGHHLEDLFAKKVLCQLENPVLVYLSDPTLSTSKTECFCAIAREVLASRLACDEPGITRYADSSPTEKTAEALRLYVLNPSLLQRIRPTTFALIERYLPMIYGTPTEVQS